MKLSEWQIMVADTIARNPEWLAPTIAAINSGVKARLDSEITKRADAETALVIAFTAVENGKGIPDRQRPIVVGAIKNSKMYGGTEYTKDLV